MKTHRITLSFVTRSLCLALAGAALLLSGCDFGDETQPAPSIELEEEFAAETTPAEKPDPTVDKLSAPEVPEAPDPTSDPTQDACEIVEKTLHIANRIDGRSRLKVQNFYAQYHHFDHAAPGLHEHDDNCQVGPDTTPLVLHDATYINGVPWLPEWPEKGENRDCHCDSDRFVSDELLVPQADGRVTLDIIHARGQVTLVETPSAANGHRLVIEWDDNPPGGCDFYEVEVRFRYLKCEPEPESWCEDQFDTDLVCAMDADTCLFYAVTDGSTCADYCAERGGECVDAFHDEGDECTKEGPSYCDEPAADQLCECLRVPGAPSGPAIVVQAEIRWGYFRPKPWPDSWTDWSGGISVSDGTLALEDLIYWDKHDLMHAQEDPSLLTWDSWTRPHNDGFLVTIEAGSLDALVTIETQVDTLVFTAGSLATLNMVVFVDDQGNELRVSSSQVNSEL